MPKIKEVVLMANVTCVDFCLKCGSETRILSSRNFIKGGSSMAKMRVIESFNSRGPSICLYDFLCQAYVC